MLTSAEIAGHDMSNLNPGSTETVLAANIELMLRC